MSKFVKLNHRYGVLEYPVTLKEMEEISKEFPKTERKFYEYAFKTLRKVMKENENIYRFDVADPSLTKTGFIVVGENNLYLVSMKGGLFGGADVETVKYADVREVDFDIIPSPGVMQGGVLYIKTKGLIGNKKRTIRNISEHDIDMIVKTIRERASVKA
ncbi:PH domain-containing protein [Thermaerobacillus caldiproteolyticus]|uniref:PH domain-containing protein n=1 Tax=Thermaerobacillus caldiproteolyticus TaxID=247480 RepID=UPI001F167983|nr:PH domain-containing protein [Anoxybacillus caldiproteolyticus]